MIINPQVPMHRLVLSLSDAVDRVHPLLADHQQRVAYIAVSVGRAMKLSERQMIDLFLAAAMHDIGLIGLENRLQGLHVDNAEGIGWHSESGYILLADNPLFGGAAQLVRYHHTPWDNGQCLSQVTEPITTQILFLADEVQRAIDDRSHVLQQRDGIIRNVLNGVGHRYHPDVAEAFTYVARSESFWLDCLSERIYGLLLATIDWPMLSVDADNVSHIAEIFARIVDAMSPWTATHSAGVTAVAAAIAQRMHFGPREVALIRTAGYLHDLGKLSVSSAILDKPGKLDPSEWAVMKAHPYHTYRILETIGEMQEVNEWASFHHERLDGEGYPFHHRARDLTLGSRIMAISDTFTAITENRPYRKGMTRDQAMGVLERLVLEGAFDGDVVTTVKSHFDEIDGLRRDEQRTYAAKQSALIGLIRPQCEQACRSNVLV